MEPTDRLLYQPLGQSERRFRLVRLPESDTNGTQWEMRSFSLLDDHLPPWKALSYRWGEDNPEFTIYINGHPVPVRKGLHTFITQMMAEKQRDWYFIDALCIDQDNEWEKAVQVQQMSEIYRRAEEVVAWIVLERYYYEKDEDVWRRVVWGPDDATHDPSLLSREELEKAVLANSYWSRLWILQEVLLAQRLTIRIGNAELEWTNLLPEEAIFDDTGLPRKNENLGKLMDFGSDPYSNELAAQNILSYRQFKSRCLRAGHRLPFHKAVEYFAMQRCSIPHDGVFGYLGLTNSRIQIDYTMPILDLFVATLADWLLSAGFIRQDLTGFPSTRIVSEIAAANDITVVLLAFGFDPCKPIVHLLFREVTKFFAPGFEESLTKNATLRWWCLSRYGSNQDFFNAFTNVENSFGLKYIESWVLKSFTFIASEMHVFEGVKNRVSARLEELKEEDAMMFAPGESEESKTYSQWAAHARAISEQICRRFMESGEDVEADMNDESWIETS